MRRYRGVISRQGIFKIGPFVFELVYFCFHQIRALFIASRNFHFINFSRANNTCKRNALKIKRVLRLPLFAERQQTAHLASYKITPKAPVKNIKRVLIEEVRRVCAAEATRVRETLIRQITCLTPLRSSN